MSRASYCTHAACMKMNGNYQHNCTQFSTDQYLFIHIYPIIQFVTLIQCFSSLLLCFDLPSALRAQPPHNTADLFLSEIVPVSMPLVEPS